MALPDLGVPFYGSEPILCDAAQNIWIQRWYYGYYGSRDGEQYAIYVGYALVQDGYESPFAVMEFSQDYQGTLVHAWVFGQYVELETFLKGPLRDACEAARIKLEGKAT